MLHRTFIILAVLASAAASYFVAELVSVYSIWYGFLTLATVGLVPAKLAELLFPSLIVTGLVLLYLVRLGVQAWNELVVQTTIVFCTALVGITAIANVHTYLVHKNRFPYGWSHCCLKGIGGSLRSYAREHEGRFPSGASTPEASLSLLLTNYCNVQTLKGKTVKTEIAEEAYQRNGALDQNSCSWHYVEGLTEGDHPEIAIVWDKVPGLGHNGERRRDNATAVLFLDGHEDYVPAAKWADFLKRQQELLAARPQRLKDGLPAIWFKLRLPNGEIVDRFDGPFTFKFAGYTRRGTNLTPQTLRWNRISINQGTLSPSLTLPGMRSKPVEVVISNFWPESSEVVIEMESLQ